MKDVLLRLAGVGRRYGDREVLRAVTLDLAEGEIVAVRGDNGSGKSTLLRIACGRERPTTGTVLLHGEPLDEDAPATRARIATVMDTGAHYPDLTVREHLMLVALSHGLGPDAAQAVADVLEDHRLAGHSGVLPSALSSGQLQALALSAAFVRPHDLLVLDEPEQRLDSRARRQLADRLAAHRDRGAAVLLATHLDALTAIADRVFTIASGTLSRATTGHPAAWGR